MFGRNSVEIKEIELVVTVRVETVSSENSVATDDYTAPPPLVDEGEFELPPQPCDAMVANTRNKKNMKLQKFLRCMFVTLPFLTRLYHKKKTPLMIRTGGVFVC